MNGFHCRTCGAFHAELPLTWGPDAPLSWAQMTTDERGGESELTADLCILQGRYYFVRGRLLLPIVSTNRHFEWLVWCSLSAANFQRTVELWERRGRDREPPYFGWLNSALPGYPDTLSLKTHVHTQAVGQRPLVELEPTDHPLAVEQREGITWEAAVAKAEALLHAG